MILGINALSTKSGGGISSVVFLLKNARWKDYGFRGVVLYTHPALVKKIEPHPDLKIVTISEELSLLGRWWWETKTLPELMKKDGVGLLWLVSGYGQAGPIPTISALQNQLPFDPRSLSLFAPWDPIRLKMQLLRRWIASGLKNSAGAVFLSQDSLRRVQAQGLAIPADFVVNPFGIEPRFFQNHEKRELRDRIRVCYVSTIFPYKHHLQVVRTIHQLRKAGYPVELTLVGDGPARYLEPLRSEMRHLDPNSTYMRHLGGVDFSKMPEIYRDTDVFLYASSCETFGAILLEAMAASLPIVSSSEGPMRELLGENGFYFDPFREGEMFSALKKMFELPIEQRKSWGEAVQARARSMTWESYAERMFSFFQHTAVNRKKS